MAAIADKVRAFSDPSPSSYPLTGRLKKLGDINVQEILQDRFMAVLPGALAGVDERFGKDSALHEFGPESLFLDFTDLFLIGVMTGCDFSSWSVKFVLSRLKENLRNMSFLVNDKIYIPAPPLYLPQPFPDGNDGEPLPLFGDSHANSPHSLSLELASRRTRSTVLRCQLDHPFIGREKMVLSKLGFVFDAAIEAHLACSERLFAINMTRFNRFQPCLAQVVWWCVQKRVGSNNAN